MHVCPDNSSALFQIGVELLEVILRELVELNMSQSREDVQIDPMLIGNHSAFTNTRLTVSFVPEFQPVTEGHFRVDGIGTHSAFFLDGLFELLFAFCFRFCEDAFRNGIAIFLVANYIPAFEGSVRLFDDASCSAGSSFLSHGFSPFPRMFDMKSSVTTAACFCISLVT